MPSPEDGGRIIFVFSPKGWAALGFPEVDSEGRKVRYQVVRNVPGRQDAGCIWQSRYDQFMLGQMFTQSIVDRRVFYRRLPDGKLFVIGVYVDDNWIICDDDAVWDEFHAAWKREFDESDNVVQAADDFCGIRTEDLLGGAVALSSKKLLLSLHDMIKVYPCPSHVATPMLPDSLMRMREVGALCRGLKDSQRANNNDSLANNAKAYRSKANDISKYDMCFVHLLPQLKQHTTEA